MSITAEAPIRGAAMAGHNRISTQALTSVARAAAGEALGVPAHDVRADWSDDDGLLALSLVMPVAVPNLTAVLRDPGRVAGFGGSIWERAVAAKAEILRRVIGTDRSAAEPGGHPHQRGRRARGRPGTLSQDTQNAGIDSAGARRRAVPGSAPLGFRRRGHGRIVGTGDAPIAGCCVRDRGRPGHGRVAVMRCLRRGSVRSGSRRGSWIRRPRPSG